MKDETLLLIGAGVLAYFFLKGSGTANAAQPASATLGQSLQNLSNDMIAATNQATGLSNQAQQLFGQSGS